MIKMKEIIEKFFHNYKELVKFEYIINSEEKEIINVII